MNTQQDIIHRFHTALPRLREWIDAVLDVHEKLARPVGALGFERLAACFPDALLRRSKVVSLDSVPFPPLADFGLAEFAPIEQSAYDGITFKDTFFLRQGCTSESLHFHEMVHVVQWMRLGVDRFLLAYGLGLLRFGYAQSPLERMAFTLQHRFEHGTPPPQLVRIIERETDAIWDQAAPVVLTPAGGADL